MKTNNLISFIILFLITLILSVSVVQKVSANGCMMMPPPDPYADRWDFVVEKEQNAYINYENGIEKMILTVGIDAQEDDIYWIFPVPADATEVELDILAELPKFEGEEISKKAEKMLDRTSNALIVNQIYTWPFIMLRNNVVGYGISSVNTLSSDMVGMRMPYPNDVVTVHKHVEKEGITSEVVSATTAKALENHLSKEGVEFNVNSMPILNEYIDEGYSFIVSWITATGSSSGGGSGGRDDNPNGDDDFYIPPGHRSNAYQESPTQNSPTENVNNTTTNTNLNNSQNNNLNTNNEFIPAPTPYPDPIRPVPKPNPDPKPTTQHKGVYVEFPTKKIYFPMKLTSVYEQTVVPAEIRIIGFVKPKTYREIENYVNTEYYIDENPSQNDFLLDFYRVNNSSNSNTLGSPPLPPPPRNPLMDFIDDIRYEIFGISKNKKSEPLKYTKVTLNPPSLYLTEDLWFKEGAPFNTRIGLFVGKEIFRLRTILIIVNSMIASLMAGYLFFPYLRKRPLKLALMGLANLLSILGLMLFTFFTTTKETEQDISKEKAELKRLGYIRRRWFAAILLALNFPFLMISIAALLIYGFMILVESLYFILDGRSFLYYIDDIQYLITPLLLWTIPVIVFFVGLSIANVKGKDKVFQSIKNKGYSTWSFKPKDSMKILYIIFFSISYIILSYFSVYILRLIVTS